jgi:hypothetical protein
MKWCPILTAARLVEGESKKIAILDSICDDPNCQFWEICHSMRKIDYTQSNSTQTCTVNG